MFGSEVPFGKPKFWSSAAETVTRPCERTQRRRAVHLTVVVTVNFVTCVLTTVYVFPVSDVFWVGQVACSLSSHFCCSVRPNALS